MSGPGIVTELPQLPPRRPDSHKGDYGRLLIVGGSVGMCGAVALAANAAFRAGVGLVKLVVPENIQPQVAVLCPLATSVGLPASQVGTLVGTRFLLERLIVMAEECDVMIVGPGLGQESDTAALVRDLVSQSQCPVVLDADGLRALGPNPRIEASVTARLIMTPHTGEFAALTATTVEAINADRKAALLAMIQTTPAVIALKGHRTLVADASRLYVNSTGNPGMATAGAGDVLCGVIAALIGQGLPLFEAATLGVYLHGAAGDAAARRLGQVSLTANDLIDALPEALCALPSARPIGFAQHSGT